MFFKYVKVIFKLILTGSSYLYFATYSYFATDVSVLEFRHFTRSSPIILLVAEIMVAGKRSGIFMINRFNAPVGKCPPTLLCHATIFHSSLALAVRKFNNKRPEMTVPQRIIQ